MPNTKHQQKGYYANLISLSSFNTKLRQTANYKQKGARGISTC